MEVCSYACTDPYEEEDSEEKIKTTKSDDTKGKKLYNSLHIFDPPASSFDFTSPFNPDEDVNPINGTVRDSTFANWPIGNHYDNHLNGNTTGGGKGKIRDLSISGGIDERRPFQNRNYPARAVGMVMSANGFQCTGTMVGPNIMLTAKHCVQWTRDGFLDMTFTPSYQPGEDEAPYGAARARPHSIFRVVNTFEQGPYNDVAYDWVVVALDWAIGNVVGWMGVASFQGAWLDMDVWDHIGYPEDFGGQPIFFGDGAVKEISGSFASGTALVLESDVDTINGQSGGPLYSRFKDGYYVVAVCSANDGNDADDYNYWAGGSNLVNLVSWMSQRSF